MIIGIPKEIMHGERRVAATPETVAKFVKDGAHVLVENGAGVGAFFADEAYAAVGAEMVADVADLYKRADVILKVKEPLFNEEKGCSLTFRITSARLYRSATSATISAPAAA